MLEMGQFVRENRQKMRTGVLLFSLLFAFASIGAPGQNLPRVVTRYLDRNFSGWKLAGQCSGEKHNAVIPGDFDGNGKLDYAVKFVRRDRGFLIAFLIHGEVARPYYLHIWSDPDEAMYSSLILFKKGERDDQTGTPILRYDSPADYHCESDVGGIHTFKNGKFVAY